MLLPPPPELLQKRLEYALYLIMLPSFLLVLDRSVDEAQELAVVRLHDQDASTDGNP